ncbi:MAG: asparagine synthase (glutamine-hydrolyzing) [Candidatus Dojkabacteria bacterium]|nr:asparagine synthase (glutamine-hydrolyzing) [Candidatus Dojkabacteria bacterium]
MCGIVGFSGPPDTYILKKMTKSIFHRGPDDEAFLELENFSIGFRRLAIIDLSKNIYPVTNETDTLFVFLNGEIYNYIELREELIEKKHTFKTKSDTEVIVHGYEEWGENVVKHLRGMFVFVIYDSRNDSLFIARDRLGIKQLYYTEYENRFVFASEIKAIFAGFNVDRKPNDQVVYNFLAYRLHDIDKNTFFSKIKRLLPGHFMLVDKFGNVRVEKYWEPQVNTQFSSNKSDSFYSQKFREIFIDVINRHLISDVPVGVTLSGGLDSSGVACVSKKLWEEKNITNTFYTFSAIHPNETIDETIFIDEVNKFTGATSIKVQPNVDQFWRDFDLWFYFQEEPTISTAPYAYYVVMREAKKYVTVILSGQGGDELLAGYIPYFFTYLQSTLMDGRYFTAIREIFMGLDNYSKFIINKIESLLKRNQINPKDFLSLDKEYAVDLFFEHKKNLNERLAQDVLSTSCQCLLRYEDKNSMANSLESRVPFFDHELVEFIFSLPIDQKIKFGWTRYVYRQALKGLMPEKNRLRRSKIGFVNPEWEWIDRKKEIFFEVFESSLFKSRKYWNAEKILWGFKKALNGQLKGELLFFWRVFIVEMWLRCFVDDLKVRDTSAVEINT